MQFDIGCSDFKSKIIVIKTLTLGWGGCWKLGVKVQVPKIRSIYSAYSHLCVLIAFDMRLALYHTVDMAFILQGKNVNKSRGLAL